MAPKVFETLDDVSEDPIPQAAWDRLMRLREEVAVMLEEARRDKIIGSSLEGAVALTRHDALETDRALTGTEGGGLADLFIVSETREGPSEAPPGSWRESQAYPGLEIAFVKASGRRCDRCWKVKPDAERTGVCDRCRSVIGGAAA